MSIKDLRKKGISKPLHSKTCNAISNLIQNVFILTGWTAKDKSTQKIVCVYLISLQYVFPLFLVHLRSQPNIPLLLLQGKLDME